MVGGEGEAGSPTSQRAVILRERSQLSIIIFRNKKY